MPPAFAGAGSFVIAVDRDGVAIAIGNRGDRSLVVGEQIVTTDMRGARALEPHLRRIRALAMNIAAQHVAPLVIFRNQRIAIVQEPRRPARPTAHLPQPSQRIISPSPAQIRGGPAADQRLASRLNQNERDLPE